VRSNQRFGRCAQRVCCRDKVGLVICEEFQDCRLDRTLADAVAQALWRQAG